MPYAGRPNLPPLHLEELARQRQQRIDAAAAAADALQDSCDTRWLRPSCDSGRGSERTVGHGSPTRDASPHRPSSISSRPGRVISLAPPGGHRANEYLDLPRSVSPGRTPLGSPRSTDTAAVPPSPPPPTHSFARPRVPERNYSAPTVRTVALAQAPAVPVTPDVVAPPPSKSLRTDPIAGDIDQGRRVLRLLRAQELIDYESHDRQQRIDSHEIQKLMAALRSWGKECELNNTPGSAHSTALPGTVPLLQNATDVQMATQSKLRALKLALARGGSASAEGPPEGRSPQNEIRNPFSPPLSRQSSSSSRQGFFRFSPMRKNSEPSSARSSVSGESMYSRDSIISYTSAASSAASAAFLSPAEGVLSPNMLDPLIADLSSILANEWNIDQCLLSLPSLLLRLEVLDTWLYGLRLRRKRASPSGMTFVLTLSSDASQTQPT